MSNNKVLLTENFVEDLPPAAPGKRHYFYDKEVSGFGVAVTDKGTKSFILYRKIDASPKRITLGRYPDLSLIDAKAEARRMNTQIDKGEDITTPLTAAASQTTALKKRVYAGACLFLLFTAGAGVFLRHEAAEEKLQSLIAFAIDDHLNNRNVSIRSENPYEIKEKLESKIPFNVEIPAILPDFRIAGASSYNIGTNAVAYSLWNAKNNNEYSLLQVRLADFNLRSTEVPRLVKPENVAVKRTPCEVLYWSHGPYGFILVADHGALLEGVTPAPTVQWLLAESKVGM